ncbi:hypothetical protein [Bartonella birtlesii]|uniref:hypothetical protein n=1 Tax=Bartonella birtlesii TaxID=111504 RepID=UPI001FD789EC|nr:hypothetical protein [Bartonella birtlesii]
MAVFLACSASSVQSAARWFAQYTKDDTNSRAAEKAADAVKKATGDAADKADAVKKAAGDAADKAGDAVKKAAGDAADKADAVKKAAGDAADKAGDAVKKAVGDAADKAGDAVNKAGDAVKKAVGDAAEKAADTTLSVQGALQSRESILENQKVLFKDYDLDKLLHNIRTVLEHNNLKTVQKQFHQLFDKKDSSVYSCAFENAVRDESLPIVKEQMDEHKAIGREENDTKAESRGHEDHLQEAQNLLEKAHRTSDGVKPQQDNDASLVSSKALYKKGYDFFLAANYVEAEKAFCAFQQHYKTDPLSEDALFWLAEALLGQKRYHEAAQVYLNVWYADKKKAYTSEILLKLARSMVALEQNKEACALFTKKAKHSKNLESVFCKSLKRGGVVHGAH